MYYVYILKSLVNGYIYIGSCSNFEKRIKRHNGGLVRSTKAYRPWILLESRECLSRSEAMKLEKFLKTGQQKEIIRRKYGAVAKN